MIAIDDSDGRLSDLLAGLSKAWDALHAGDVVSFDELPLAERRDICVSFARETGCSMRQTLRVAEAFDAYARHDDPNSCDRCAGKAVHHYLSLGTEDDLAKLSHWQHHLDLCDACATERKTPTAAAYEYPPYATVGEPKSEPKNAGGSPDDEDRCGGHKWREYSYGWACRDCGADRPSDDQGWVS